MTRFRVLPKLSLICITALLASAYGQDAIHAVAGAVTKIDKTAKTLHVRWDEWLPLAALVQLLFVWAHR